MNLHLDRACALALFLALLVAPAAAAALPSDDPAPETPNVVYILADDLGYGDLGCFNPEARIPTPHADRLAREGLRFTDAHSGSAVCTPTRYGLLTGRYAWRTRLEQGVLMGYDPPLIEPDRLTVPALFEASGYRTACIGKWHLGLGWATTDGEPLPWCGNDGSTVDFTRRFSGGPLAVGFGSFFGISASLDMPPYCYVQNNGVTEVPDGQVEASTGAAYWRAGALAPSFKHQEVLPMLTQQAVQYIDRSAARSPREPFFLYLPLTAPHTPVLPVAPYAGRSQAGAYGDFVAQVDGSVGAVLAALSRNGLEEETLVIVASDNGAPWSQEKIEEFGHRANGDLRGQKADIWEGGHRIPFIARWPGRIPPGTRSDETICLIDLLATCAELLDRELPDDAGEDSFSILPLLLDPTAGPVRESLVQHAFDGMFALRQGRWKLIEGRGSGGFTKPRRVEPEAGEPIGQLYDLEADPAETTNLYQQRPELVARLSAALEACRKRGRSRPLNASALAGLPGFDAAAATPVATDWLVVPTERRAGVYRDDRPGHAGELVLDNGLIRRQFRLTPNAATIGYDNLMTGAAILRGVKPEALVTIDGTPYEVGGLKGQPNYAYLDPRWRDGLTANPDAFEFVDLEVGPIEARLPWKRVRHCAPDAAWPPAGVHLRMDYRRGGDEMLVVSVHYALYDGIPALSKWISVHNDGEQPVTLDSFTSEVLAAVEYASHVDARSERGPTPNLHVQTDYAFASMAPENACRLSVHWVPDPDYASQVDYRRRSPCLLEVRPTIGPAQEIAPGESFASFRAWELVYDGTERERNGLALRRLYRTIAPWVTENPLMMHVRHADWESVREAIEQCANVGFEMVILTFGSGFNLEDESPEALEEWEWMADFAKTRGVEIGGYSLLASRRIEPESDNALNPETETIFGQTFGTAPALASAWGQNYFRKLRQFYGRTGFSLLEHDGSYPGDLDASARPPLQKGVADSRWVQWRIITDFYKWCRGRGVYLNVPDFYYLSGSNKCGMGYRETNWSLPRAQQVLHTRQNIFDGTWEKTPSMGWMFVPLTEYHGGGAAATIEPLEEHLDHYSLMLGSNLALGVQACYRGPRLYDSDRTFQLVHKWVSWFKEYRDILESDVIHGRRADGRDLDWMLHVNPRLEHKGMLVVFNPLDQPVQRTLTVPLYYTGLTEAASIRERREEPRTFILDREYRVRLPVELPPRGFSWFVIE